MIRTPRLIPSIRRAAVALLLLPACAAQPPPRDTIQAGAVAKSDFAGVFYLRQTVVGVPFSTGFTFVGEQGDNELDKVRWDIQEDVLIARRAFEFVRGTEKGQPAHGDPYLGAPVAAFKIKSHFDIIRDYNASTGEELNKIVENSERKWYERKLMRVDWSVNLISNFQFLADWDHGGISAIRQDPAPYWVTDPADPDAMRVERPGKDQPADYLEITQKIVAAPQSVDFEDFTNVPLCYLEYATEDCASQEIKIRYSFLRAGERDYDPLVYDDHMMERFGYFTTERKSYNRQYGQTESGRVRLINRFNLWQHNLSPKACRKDDECGGGAGARCALEIPESMGGRVDPAKGDYVGRCTYPFAARNLENPEDPGSRDLGPRQVVYYLNDRHPKDLFAAAQLVAKQYDDTYRGIVRTLSGREPPHDVFVLCANNPVQAGDPAPCGPPGRHVRIGDLRYNMLYWVDEPQSARLLGYGPSSHDPETGETISGQAFVYGASIDHYAASARDVVRLVNGDLAPGDFIDGVDVKEWVAEHRQGPSARTFTQAEVDQMAAGMDLSWAQGLPQTPSVRKGAAGEMAKMIRARSAALARSQTLGADRGVTAGRLARLKGTDLERRLVNGEILLARGMDPRRAATAADVRRAAPLGFVNPAIARAMRRERRRLGARGVDLAETFDDAVLGFALQQKGKDATDVWRKIRTAVYRSTAEHELGHTVGLRHNFAGSFDPMNYPKTYWDLRLADKTARPRYLDPETPAEQKGVVDPAGLQAGISEFQYSSIMDYGAKFNSDIQGLGRYDRAALKFGYGELLEVFNKTKDSYLLGALQATVAFGYPQPLLVDCKGDNYISLHYTKLPGIVELHDRRDVHVSGISKTKVATQCEYPDPVEHDEDNRLVVPYKFCSDEFEGASTECLAFDRGADVYEIADHAIQSYRKYYLFDSFKRDQAGFNPEGHLDRVYERYLDPLRGQMQFYALFRADFAADLPDDGKATNFWRSPDHWGAFTVGVTQGFNLLGEIITMPEPGEYHLFTLPDGRKAYHADPYAADTAAFELHVPDGRFLATSWDYDSGYYWYERVHHVGHFVDKVAAITELTDPETWFLGADEASDVRQYAINYWRLFPKQINDFYGALMSDRWDRYAPMWSNRKVRPRPLADPGPDPQGNERPVDPQVGFSVQLFAATFGMALIPATFDYGFVDSARIFLQGNGQQIDSQKPKVTFTDPFSGRIYVAFSFLDAQKNETGIAARMLLRADELHKLWLPKRDPALEVALRNYLQIIEVVRTLTVYYADAAP